jgi:DNA-directed RNA polymerase specialized sigma24 family protein
MGKPRWKAVVEEKLVSPRREIPAASLGGAWILDGTSTPSSELEALMQTPPGGTVPEIAVDAQESPYDALERYVGASLELTEFEEAVLDAKAIAGLSYRETAKLLGCSASTVHRTYTAILGRIFEKHARR